LGDVKVPWSRVLSFDDPFLCQAAVQAAQVEILPTIPGAFRAELTQIGMNKVWMQRFNLAQPLVSTSAANLERKVIGFLTDGGSPELHHCGLELEPHHMLVYGNEVLHQRSQRGLQYATMSVPTEEFPTLCRTIIGREFFEGPNISALSPDPSLMSRLVKLHKGVVQLAHNVPDVLLTPGVLQALESDLIHTLTRCVASGAGIEASAGDRRHSSIMRRFEEFLETNSDRPIYLAEICAAISASERTLRVVCEEHLGMGPIRFLTLRRIYLARAALFRGDPRETSVTRIATDHGFWELGRFSVAYRALFGETPSETLRRPAELLAIHINRPSSFPIDVAAGHLN
jgi:AraC-like DNA-binding protein